MPVCPEEDIPIITAASRELLNWMSYRGLSPDQQLQTLVTLSAAFLSALSELPEEVDLNVASFCRAVRHYSKVNRKSKRRLRRNG